MAALLTDGSGIVLATAGGVALAIPSLEARAGARADAGASKAVTDQAAGRAGPRADAAAAKAAPGDAAARAGALGEAIGIRVASGGAEARAGGLGDAAALKEAAGAAEARAGVLGDAAALKAATASAEARAGLTGEAIPHTSADVTLSATGTAGARGEAVGTATINPADETGQGSGGSHRDGIKRISMREKRARDLAEFERKQVQEAAQGELVGEADELPEVAPAPLSTVQLELHHLVNGAGLLPELALQGVFLEGASLLPGAGSLLLERAQHAAALAGEQLAEDDEEALALILEALAL